MAYSILAPRMHRGARPGLAAQVVKVFDLWRQRRALSQLDDRLLRDVGLTQEQAKAEIKRPIWDAPSSWMM
ncbi:MAG: DUF1127 domain-containing protein [Pseudomonadota bacterium]